MINRNIATSPRQLMPIWQEFVVDLREKGKWSVPDTFRTRHSWSCWPQSTDDRPPYRGDLTQSADVTAGHSAYLSTGRCRHSARAPTGAKLEAYTGVKIKTRSHVYSHLTVNFSPTEDGEVRSDAVSAARGQRCQFPRRPDTSLSSTAL